MGHSADIAWLWHAVLINQGGGRGQEPPCLAW